MTRWLLACVAALALLTGAVDAGAREKHQRVVAHEPRIICGQTGCFEIPLGCNGELRRTGRSVVAVVWCNKK